ncbi:MAG: hypothetical protein F7C35_05645 [Desulfurococcales archaeon]|nr:hypothetical protein [Desulfurococcales archaeon]
MGSEEDPAKSCFEALMGRRVEPFEAGGVYFYNLPFVDGKVTSKVPAGKSMDLVFCFKNPDNKEKEPRIRFEIPKRKGLKSTGMYMSPEEGQYYKVTIPPESYKAVSFTLYTTPKTPPGKYKIALYVWFSRKRTLARSAASIAASMALGKLGSAIAKGAIKDEKAYEREILVL